MRSVLFKEMGLLPVWVQRPEKAVGDILDSAPDWDGLKQSIASCTSCPLHLGRNKTVVGVGNERADWLFVGEAPGEEEDRIGEPFVGQSGQLLDNMFFSIGLSRQKNVYIANTVKCRPPGNRNPEAAEMDACRPYLSRQIEWIRPKLIVALGKVAAQSLLNSGAPVSAMRGKIHDYQGISLVVTFHPAYLLRNPQEKAKAWADLCLARKCMNELQKDISAPI